MGCMQKSCNLQEAFNQNLEVLHTINVLFTQRFYKSCTNPNNLVYIVSTLQPFPSIKSQRFWHVTCVECSIDFICLVEVGLRAQNAI
jgi:hypothetical protein